MKKIMILASLLTATTAFSQHAHWGYEGDSAPENWGNLEEAQTCGKGKFQSPINILNSTKDKKLPKITFNYGDADIKDVVDNGHSLQFDFKEGSTITYNKKVYTLVQFHAHEESEHTIEGIRYPLELHFVHKANDGSTLVIGLFVKEGQENSYFSKLSVFKSLVKEAKADTDILFNPEKIFPKDKAYYHYMGSLTTPPCSENVDWILFKNPVTLSESEIKEISKHLPKHNNRPVQPLNGREIRNN